MRLRFIVIYLAFMVSARRRKPKLSQSFPEDILDQFVLPYVGGYLNLKGKIRGEFALKAALEAHTTNMICSPMSLLMPIGKLAMGAGPLTEKELLHALHLSNTEQLHPTFKKLITSLQYLPGVTLDMANKFYVSTKNEINKTYESRTKLVFNSLTKKIKTTHPIEAANTINRWVANKTRNKITDLISPRDITQDTSLVIVNAIYFAGKWLNKFEKTFTDNFFSLAATHKIPMMSRKGKYKYWKCETLNSQIIEIPYEGLQSAMIIVLPSSNIGLGVLLRALKVAPELLNIALLKMKMTNVILTMPKFKIESKLDVKDLLIKLGLRTIFDAKRSDLNGIIENQIVFVTTAIQRATIEVTELGTEASAATAITMQTMSSPVSLRFVANHPFYFIITVNQEQLFAGIFNG